MSKLWQNLKKKLEKSQIRNMHESVRTQESVEDDKAYLIPLLESLKKVKEAKQMVAFEIKSLQKIGFVVKVRGLYAFILFNNMPWKYNLLSSWNEAGKLMIGARFTALVGRIIEDPIQIRLDARKHLFEPHDLVEGVKYMGVVIEKTKKGVYLEFGHIRDWRYGSLNGFLSQNLMNNKKKLSEILIGEELVTIFNGYDYNGKMILSDKVIQKEWLERDLTKLKGTVVKVWVYVNEDNSKRYLVDNIYKAILPVRRKLYFSNYSNAKAYVEQLSDGDVIECAVKKVDLINYQFVLKLILK